MEKRGWEKEYVSLKYNWFFHQLNIQNLYVFIIARIQHKLYVKKDFATEAVCVCICIYIRNPRKVKDKIKSKKLDLS